MFQTGRLYIRKISTLDAPFIYQLLNSPGWLQYVGDRGVDSVEKAETYIVEHYLGSYKNGLGNFVVTLSSSGIPIGTCGLYQRDNLEHPDIGFAFLPEYIGKGYGYEAARCLLDYAQNDLQLPKILGFTVNDNVASIKLLEKLGLRQMGTYTFVDDTEELLLFCT